MKLSKTSFAAGAVAALVIGSGSAYAATGGNFILGKSNSAGATTTLSNANGTALSLNSKSGYAPLKVNRSTKVANLNADKLDGIDSSSFARSGMGAGSYDVYGTADDAFPVAEGTTLVYVVATCPAGTLRTGGGYSDFTSSGVVLWNGPDTDDYDRPNSWSVGIQLDDTAGDTPEMVGASITCLNPKGAAPAGSYRAGSTKNNLERYQASGAAKR